MQAGKKDYNAGNPKATNWMGTCNNPEIAPEVYLKQMFETGKCKYVSGQLEKGSEGTEHIQFYVCFNS